MATLLDTQFCKIGHQFSRILNLDHKGLPEASPIKTQYQPLKVVYLVLTLQVHPPLPSVFCETGSVFLRADT